MIQNILALIIVFSAVVYIIFSTVKTLMARRESNCTSCAGCSFKNDVHPRPLPVKLDKNSHIRSV
jgi:hypothetical protein